MLGADIIIPFVTDWHRISQKFGGIRKYLYLCNVKSTTK